MNKVDNINTLYLIGNGFDLHHGISSGYPNFKDWLENNNYVLYNRLFQTYDLLGYDLWGNLEANMAKISVEAILNSDFAAPFLMLISNPNEADYNGLSIDLGTVASEIYSFKDIYMNLQFEFENWIDSLSPASPDRKVYIDVKNSFFINFNYTETLEIMYNVPRDKVYHIHGNACANENLIFGHNQTTSNILDQWNFDNYGEDDQDALHCAAEKLQYFYKDVESIIRKNLKLWNGFYSVNTVHVWGLSLGEVDIPYIRHLKSILPKDVKWEFSWYGHDDKQKVKEVTQLFNIENYSLIRLNDIIKPYPKQLSLFNDL